MATTISNTAREAPSLRDAVVLAPQFAADELERFHEHGFLVVRGLADELTTQRMLKCTQAAVAARIEPVEYEADLRYPGAPESRNSAGGNTIRRVKQAHARDPVFTEFIGGSRVVERLRQLLGPRIAMPLAHHNCIMTKQPQFSSETGWHQDIRYWSYERPELVSLWVALGRETSENGCLHVIPGTHRAPFARERLDHELFLRPEIADNALLIEQQIPVPLEPGDALFFHCCTFHAAGRNQTAETKYSAVFTFRSADNLPKPGSRSASMPDLLLP